MSKCTFLISWRGLCNKPTLENSNFCEAHALKPCVSCGEQAVEECEATIGAFTCGSLLCSNCEHTIQEDGTTGYALQHCKKDAQIYKPWYNRSKKE